MILQMLSRLVLVAFVILSYAYWGYISPYSYSLNRAATTHYHYLSEGLLSGHLHLSISPPAELLDLSDPYDPNQNKEFRITSSLLQNGTTYGTFGFHDMSLYKKNMYLYFGPLPALSFFIPFKFATHFYPSESLAVLFFLSFAFIMQFAVLIKIKNTYLPNISEGWLIFFGLILSIANNSAFLLNRPVFYEAAISSGFCALSISLFFLYNSFTNKAKKQDLMLFSFFIAVSVAGRPHYVFVCIALLLVVWYFLIKYSPNNQRISRTFALFLPAVFVGLFLALYNYFRFDSVFEFGTTYMLSGLSNGSDLPTLSIKNIPQNILYGLYYYLFQPYNMDYLSNQYYPVLPPKGYVISHITGVLYTAPLVVFSLFLPNIFTQRFKNNSAIYPLRYFLMCVMLTLVINFAFLIITMPGANQRYVTDFVPFWIMLSIISISLLKGNPLPHPTLNKLAQFLFVICGTISIVLSYHHALYQQLLPE